MGKTSRSTVRRASKPTQVAADAQYRILVDMKPRETLRQLANFDLDHCCMPQPHAGKAGRRRLHAFAEGSVIEALRTAGRKVKVLANATQEGKHLQRHVGKGDRFRGGRRGPPGVGQLV